MAYALSYPLNHDVGWWLYVVRHMLDGKQLYTELTEINPPLYGYLIAVPVLLAEIFDISVVNAARGSVAVLCLATIAGAAVLTSRVTQSVHKGVVVASALAVPLILLAGTDFGQREHVAVALASPYFVALAAREVGCHIDSREAVAIGLIAGLGFSLKPHFVVLWLGLEAYHVVRARYNERSIRSVLRPEALAAAFLISGYGLFVVLIYPEYLSLLWNSRHLYAEFAAVNRWTLVGNIYGPLLLIVAAVFVVLRFPAGLLSSLIRTLLAMAVLGWCLAVLQAKGWSYHFFPVLAGAAGASVLILVHIASELSQFRGGGGLRRILATSLLVFTLYMSASLLTRVHLVMSDTRQTVIGEQVDLLAGLGARSILILTPYVSHGFPLVNYADVDWRSPFSALWWIAAAHKHPPSGSSADIVPLATDSVEASFRRALVSEVVHSPPDVVFVDVEENERFGGWTFPYIRYLQRDPRFAELWDAYRLRERLGRYDVYVREISSDNVAPMMHPSQPLGSEDAHCRSLRMVWQRMPWYKLKSFGL